jgi:hypothetical protein
MFTRTSKYAPKCAPQALSMTSIRALTAYQLAIFLLVSRTTAVAMCLNMAARAWRITVAIAKTPFILVSVYLLICKNNNNNAIRNIFGVLRIDQTNEGKGCDGRMQQRDW